MNIIRGVHSRNVVVWTSMAVYSLALCGLVLLLSLYRYSFKPSLDAFLFSNPGLASVGAAVGILVSTYVLARLFWTSSGDGKQATLACISSVLVCVFLGVAGEVFLRAILIQKPDGAYVGIFACSHTSGRSLLIEPELDGYARMIKVDSRCMILFLGGR